VAEGRTYAMATNPAWINRDRLEQPFTAADTPYNGQVSELQARLPGARIGRIDKFNLRNVINQAVSS
jgi:hypothetical protein